MVEFGDIDKSGHYHNASVIRWLEAAEAIMHSRLGIAVDTFGLAPRVRVELEFHSRLSFMDEVDILLSVLHVGRTSVRYGLEVRHGDRLAATGNVVTVHLPEGADHAQPWPDRVRRELREGGDRSQT
jgi:acyl-CoA thioester hydrolase